MSCVANANAAMTARRPLFSLSSSFRCRKAELEAAFAQHTNAREFLWVQEEPANMGALNFLAPRLERLAHGKPFRSVKRSASSSPSTGSHTAHEMEQKTLLELAFAAFLIWLDVFL